jgi:hypothetical protein
MRDFAFSTAERDWCGTCAHKAQPENNAKMNDL